MSLKKTSNSTEEVICKKRGRKPKGGKIINPLPSYITEPITIVKPNVILHLKCFLKDLQINTLFNNDYDDFNFSNKNQLSYDTIKEKPLQLNSNENFAVNENLIEKHVSKTVDNSRKIYLLLMLVLWYNVFIKPIRS